MRKSVSLVEFSTTPTVSVMKTKTGENVTGDGRDSQPEQANSRVNAALQQLSAQEGAASAAKDGSAPGGAEEGRGLFDLE